MNLSLAQCLNTAENLPAQPGAGKMDSKTQGALGLSFPSLLSQENEELEASPIQLALLMAGKSPTLSSSVSTGESGETSTEEQISDPKGNAAGDASLSENTSLSGNTSGSTSVGQSGDVSITAALPATQAKIPLNVSPQQIASTSGQPQEKLPVELLFANGSLLLEQDVDQNMTALPMKLLGRQLLGNPDEALPTAQMFQPQTGKGIYQIDGLDPVEPEKLMLAHRHLAMRSLVGGMGTATRVQPLPNPELTGRPTPVVPAEVTQMPESAVPDAKEGLPAPLPQLAVDSTGSSVSDGSQAPKLTDQVAGSQAIQENLEIPASVASDTYRGLAMATSPENTATAHHLLQNQATPAAGLASLEDSLSSVKIPLEALMGESGKQAGQGDSKLPGNIRNQVMNQMASRLEISPEGEKLTIKLDPEHLGKVEVQFSGTKDNLTIILKASGQEAEMALQKGIKELTENILDRTQRWQTVEIRVDARETPQDKSQGRSQERRDSSRQQDQDAKHEHNGQDRHQQTGDDAGQAWGG